MSSPVLSFFGRFKSRPAVDTITPVRSFADVILPPATRRMLDGALAQVHNHALIFGRWGLGERHSTGLGLAFNFAGPPGTGKTICAEAIAGALGKKLLAVNYAEVESMWMGETPKNVAALFRNAAEQDAVLFFDEADAIAARRSVGAGLPQQRESNTTVNVLLRELEGFNGVVIFATNLAANFDPAFERRIRTHVRFEMPGLEERERIWGVQIHPTHTPLAADVDFAALAAQFVASGGDIKNGVLKAAAAAAAEPGPDPEKRIHQRHFVLAMEDVMSAKSVMQQSLFSTEVAAATDPMVQALQSAEARWRSTATISVGVAVTALAAALVSLGATIAR
ncbi:MAG: ATP-binding protein [Gemmatimonadota bacterium]